MLKIEKNFKRHYASWDTEALRYWRFEGSTNGSNWTVIKTHANDAALNGKGKAHSWPIPAQFHSTYFSYFRIIQTGENSNKHFYLALSGFEVYGTLKGAGGGGAVAAAKGATKNEFQFSYDNDTNGVVYYLGSNGGTTAWSNPGANGKMVVRASQLNKDSKPAYFAVGRTAVRCVTMAKKDSWFSFEFKTVKVMPTHYTLRFFY